MGLFFILPAVSAALTLALGLFTWLRDPRHPSNLGFAAACATVGLAEAGNSMMLLGSTAGLVLSVSGQALMPAAWLLFATVFGKPHRAALYRKAPVIAGLAATGIPFIMPAVSGGFASVEPAAAAYGATVLRTGPYGDYFHIYLVLGLTLALIHFESALRLTKGTARARIKYLVMGAGALLAFHVYVASQALLLRSIQVENVALLSTVTLISTGLMAWTVMKEKLFNIDVFVSRHVLYSSFAALLIGVYLLAVGALTHTIELFSAPFDYFFGTLFAFTALLVLAVLLTSSTLARKVELFISRNFYRHKYEFKDRWMEATARISSRMSVDEIRSTLAEMVASTTGSKTVYIWLKDARTGAFRCDEPRLGRRFAEIGPVHPLIRAFEDCGGPILAKELEEGEGPGLYEREELRYFCGSLGATLVTPLLASRELIGFISQDADRSGAEFGPDDVDFLRAVSTQAAVQIKNIRLNEDITAAKEAEVFNRMSSFIMHDLKNLTNSLSLVSRNARFNISNPEFQADAIRTIDLTVSRMKRLIGRLTEPPGESSLTRVETDLNSVIESAVKKASLSDPKGASIVNRQGPIPPVEVDPEAIETVIFNLLTNACEAVGPRGEISVSSELTAGAVSITVSDNGPGIPKAYMENSLFKPFRTTKKNGFGIGLCQCKAVVEAHGGSIEASSTEGKGSSFTVTLPVIRKSMAI